MDILQSASFAHGHNKSVLIIRIKNIARSLLAAIFQNEIFDLRRYCAWAGDGFSNTANPSDVGNFHNQNKDGFASKATGREGRFMVSYKTACEQRNPGFTKRYLIGYVLI